MILALEGGCLIKYVIGYMPSLLPGTRYPQMVGLTVRLMMLLNAIAAFFRSGHGTFGKPRAWMAGRQSEPLCVCTTPSSPVLAGLALETVLFKLLGLVGPAEVSQDVLRERHELSRVSSSSKERDEVDTRAQPRGP